MIGSNSFFPLPLTADVQSETTSVPDRSGQVVKSWTTTSNVRCLFFTNSGEKINNVREEFSQVDSFYTDPTANIVDGMRIVNIRDQFGVVVEPGPLYVQSVKRFTGFAGKIHHLSIKLKGRTQ